MKTPSEYAQEAIAELFPGVEVRHHACFEVAERAAMKVMEDLSRHMNNMLDDEVTEVMVDEDYKP